MAVVVFTFINIVFFIASGDSSAIIDSSVALNDFTTQEVVDIEILSDDIYKKYTRHPGVMPSDILLFHFIFWDFMVKVFHL